MQGLNNLGKRLRYRGGYKQQERMIDNKLASLKKALVRSYQAGTAVLPDGREFRALFNPDKLNDDYDIKEISIPYEDICLSSGNFEPTNIACGQIIEWKETATKWLVYLEYINELAYFRASLRKVDEMVEINGRKYWVYLQGVGRQLTWNIKHDIVWNDLDDTMTMYITKDEDTLLFFHRFDKINVLGREWEVQTTNIVNTTGLIKVRLKECFTNSIHPVEEDESRPSDALIIGETTVYPYDVCKYTINTRNAGEWLVDSDLVKIISSDENSIKIEIISGKSGEFTLNFKENNTNIIHTLDVQIKSL